MFPEPLVMMSLIFISQETVEKLEWAALLWILVLPRLGSLSNRPAQIDALLARKILGTPE
jgi:hypothetical protein